MYFKTSAEHEAFRAKIREFAETEVKPYTFLWDKENQFPREVVKKMGELGWMGIPFPIRPPSSVAMAILKPSPSLPSRFSLGTFTSLNSSWAVAEERMPILS